MSELPFVGYTGTVWGKCLASLNYLAAKLATTTNLQDTATLASACLTTLLNGLDAINAYRISAALAQEYTNLQSIQALPITIDATSLLVLNNRTSAMGAAASALAARVPAIGSFLSVASVLPSGAPAIPATDLLGFFKAFSYETPPAGLTVATLAAQGQAIVTAFNTIATQISVLQGRRLTLAYDTATRMALVAQAPVNMLTNFTSGPLASSINTTLFWNQLITQPAFLTDANLLTSAPYSLLSQQSCVIRYSLISMAQQIALFLLILRNPNASQVNLATVNNGDSLMDIAARSMGDFEEWTNIATLNSLSPPWISSTAASGVAAWGSQILIPTPGSAVSPSGSRPSYTNNFLGIDLYLGPINQPMLPWNGDFQVVAGYSNLSVALGRRLQTTLGTLIYHGEYGSKIPPEVGSIQTQDTTGYITAFGEAALMSDPRVKSILQAATVLQPNFAVAFTGSVQPGGAGGSPVAFNEVISPQ